jgi:membrane-associated protease RseP (regulator of RpoE activity)
MDPAPQPWPAPGAGRRWLAGPWPNALLLLATAATALQAGFALGAPPEAEPTAAAVLRHGWPYAAALLAILGTHELGHYALARRHRVDATLPYFLPAPFGFGTLGAVIRLRSPIPSRAAALDIGLAGPFAGFLVALPVLWWGMAHSTVIDAPAAPPAGLGSPLALLLAGVDWLRGLPFPAGGQGPMWQLGDSLVTRGVQRLAVGPLPPGKELLLHPAAFAGWLGMLLTSLNLVPLGQLDGGHGTYALLGRERALRLSRLASHALLACGLCLSWSWLAWWAVTRFVVRLPHPPAWDERPLGPGRRAVAVAGLVLLALTFVPVPITV